MDSGTSAGRRVETPYVTGSLLVGEPLETYGICIVVLVGDRRGMWGVQSIGPRESWR